MNVSSRLAQPSGDQPVEPVRLLAAFAETPLLDLPRLAARLGVAKVLAKDESRRMLGNFKSLGGTYAALRALARAMGTGKIERPDPTCAPGVLPTLICASDGNHGLAVAAAARLAGTASHVFLHSGVSAGRARRIVAQGAAITWVQGCYDDAVETAAVAARAGAGILVADTAADVTDPVIEDVMTGYSVIAMEIRRQVKTAGHRRPTHIFVQAGVGGLAATMITLKPWMAGPAEFIVAEPERAACVAAGMAEGRPVRISLERATSAAMLACGQASAPALKLLRRHAARSMTVQEATLIEAPSLLREHGGPATTPSGAAGLAGLVDAVGNVQAASDLNLVATSRVLILITETDIEGDLP
jgi:diaminopropionate ammonia-lyase